MSYYLSTVAIYFGVDLLAAWGLNMQFGWAGIPNFAFIIFQAVGAYVTAVLTLGPDTGANSYQHYVLGMQLPFPVPLLAAAAAGGILSLVIGIIAMARLRRDYQAAVFLLIALIATQVVSGDVGLVNGSNGLAGVPQPLAGPLSALSLAQYQWAYAGFVAVVCVVVLLFLRRLGRSGWQRALRASRDDEAAASALGLNVAALRLQVFVLGGAIAGLQRRVAGQLHHGVVAGRMGLRRDVRHPDRDHPRRRRQQLGNLSWHLPGADRVCRGAVVPAPVWLPRADR